MNHELPNVPGVITARKPRGRKHTFVVGGPLRHVAHTMLSWERVDSSTVRYYHTGSDGIQVLLTPNGYVLEEAPKPRLSRRAEQRIADRIDGYDRDDLGLSNDY